MSTISLPFSDRPPASAIGQHDPRGGASVASAAALVRRLAADPSRWRHRVGYGHGDQRWYARLDVDPDHEVWLISWLPGQETGLHDHGEALGAFVVAEGALTETAVRAPGHPGTLARTVRRTYGPHEVRGFGYEHIHDVGNHGTVPTVSLHAYAPHLTAMTQYTLVDGRLQIVASERVGVDW